MLSVVRRAALPFVFPYRTEDLHYDPASYKKIAPEMERVQLAIIDGEAILTRAADKKKSADELPFAVYTETWEKIRMFLTLPAVRRLVIAFSGHRNKTPALPDETASAWRREHMGTREDHDKVVRGFISFVEHHVELSDIEVVLHYPPNAPKFVAVPERKPKKRYLFTASQATPPVVPPSWTRWHNEFADVGQVIAWWMLNAGTRRSVPTVVHSLAEEVFVQVVLSYCVEYDGVSTAAPPLIWVDTVTVADHDKLLGVSFEYIIMHGACSMIGNTFADVFAPLVDSPAVSAVALAFLWQTKNPEMRPSGVWWPFQADLNYRELTVSAGSMGERGAFPFTQPLLVVRRNENNVYEVSSPEPELKKIVDWFKERLNVEP